VSILLADIQQAVKEDNFNRSINPSLHVRYEKATLGTHKMPHRGLNGQTNCRYLQAGGQNVLEQHCRNVHSGAVANSSTFIFTEIP
jgi:hypothetical protein